MSDNPHEGHRKRVREMFLRNGYDHNTPPHLILEHLLFYCVKQKDTNPLAHELINKYKTLSGVLDAPVSELVQFKGLTENNVTLLKLIMSVSRFYNYEKNNQKIKFNGIDEIGEFLVEQFAGYTHERLFIMLLNANGCMLGLECMAEGDPSSVGVSTKEIVRKAIDSGCVALVMAHNHPSGVALPSPADIEITSLVANALRIVDIRMIDHIIVSNGDYVSMAQSQKYHRIFEP